MYKIAKRAKDDGKKFKTKQEARDALKKYSDKYHIYGYTSEYVWLRKD